MILRTLKMTDESDMIAILADKNINKTYMLPDFDTPQDAKPLFERLLALSREKERFVRAISLDGQVIGFLNDVQINGGTIEIGYVLSSACHNRGYMTQALCMAIGELFNAGYHTVVAGAFAENSASIRVMEKNGMKPMGKEETIFYRGANHRCVYYHITKQERPPC